MRRRAWAIPMQFTTLATEPVQWMNINVTAFHGQSDAFNLGDGRVGTRSTPSAVHERELDPAPMQQVAAPQGGKGTVQYRRALRSTVFHSTWTYMITSCCPPARSVGPGI